MSLKKIATFATISGVLTLLNMKRKFFLYLLATLLFTIVTVVILTTQHVVAKDGVIIGGNNGHNNSVTQLNTTVQTRPVVVKWGRKKLGCNVGIGICIFRPDPGPHCPIDAAEAREIPLDRKVEGVARVERSRITLELTTAPPERANEIAIDEDIEIGKCSSRLLGYESIRILKGKYKVSSKGTEFGKIILSTKSQPLTSQ